MANLAPDESELYDRQIRLWGVEAQVLAFTFFM
jgi:molybdopterin/thiamine biosynthesis adenylyltransferase